MKFLHNTLLALLPLLTSNAVHAGNVGTSACKAPEGAYERKDMDVEDTCRIASKTEDAVMTEFQCYGNSEFIYHSALNVISVNIANPTGTVHHRNLYVSCNDDKLGKSLEHVSMRFSVPGGQSLKAIYSGLAEACVQKAHISLTFSMYAMSPGDIELCEKSPLAPIA